MKRLTSTLAMVAAVLAANNARADAQTSQESGTPPTDVAAGVSQQKDSGAVPEENKPVPDSTAAGVNAGMQWATGNSQLIAITGGGKLDMRRGNNGFAAALVGNYAESFVAPAAPANNGAWVDTTRNLQGKLRYDRYFTRNASAFLQVTGTHDAFQATAFRLNLDPGLKYLFVNHEKTKFWGEVGYDFEFDDNYTNAQGIEQAGAGGNVVDTSTPPRPIVIIETNTMHSARAYVGFRHAFNKEITLSAGLEYLQGFGGSGDGLPNLPAGFDDTTATRVKLNLVRSRLNFDALFAAHIAGGLSLGIGFTAKYNSAPLPGKQDVDTTTTISLIYAFSSSDKDKDKDKDKKDDAKPACPVCPDCGAGVASTPAAPGYTKTLPGGFALTGKAGGAESALVASLDATTPVDPAAAIELDRVTFTVAGDVDTQGSKAQLDNLVEILKAYPNATIKITSPGSAGRADSIRAALVSAGADGKRVITEARDGKVSVHVLGR